MKSLKKAYKFEFWALPKYVARSKKLTSTDKLVLSAFVTYKSGENEIVLKEITLSEFFSVNERSVRRTINKLLSLKVIEKKRVGKRMSNRYLLLDLEKINW